MAIQCPYCMHLMELKGAKAGRFTPRCPACKRKFALLVPDAAGDAPTVAALPGASQHQHVREEIEDALGIERAPAAQPAAKPRGLNKAALASRAGGAAVTKPPPVDVAETSSPVESMAITSPPTEPPGEHETLEPTAHPHDIGGEPELSGTVGGYRIVQRLGRGGMGSVYLARQLSLDRNVALKVLLAELAADPQFVARFTREAYAAAQLTHHNVVQIHDIGAQQRTHYFSMEFVEGQTLAGLVREHGRIDPEAAARYVLQAARGLKFAHDHGMVHRDVKPENLLLNTHGIVKVADLGLVKTPRPNGPAEAAQARAAAASGRWYDNDATQLNVSMGTPAYMPPEQAKDAAHVDQRADIYSLGCTLYALLVGRPPFEGHTAVEVITKHMRDPVTPPSALLDWMPAALSDVLMKMLAKRPADRFANMGEVIAALESFLGVETSGEFLPKEDQVKALGNCVAWFNNSSMAKLRRRLIAAYAPLALLVVALAAILPQTPRGKLAWAGAAVGFALLTPIAYLVLSGLMQRTIVMLKVRELVFAARIVDWLTWIVAAALVVALLVMMGLHGWWLGALAAAAIVAAGFHFTIDPLVQRQQGEPVWQAENLLKKMRERAPSEASIQQFVCKHAGEHWEAFFEALFGYEAKILARERWGRAPVAGRKVKGDRGQPRPKYAAWRDPVIEWIDARLAARRAARDRRHLERVEHDGLVARGIGETVARKKAKRVAESIVVKAAEIREDARARALETAPPPPAPAPDAAKAPEATEKQADAAPKQRKPALGDEGLEGFVHLSYFQRRYGGWPGFFLGSTVRFVLGAVLLTGFIGWAHQNGVFAAGRSAALSERAERAWAATADPARAADMQAAAAVTPTRPDGQPRRPLSVPVVPTSVTRLFDGWTPGVAGALLLLSAFWQGPMLGLSVVPAALVVFIGARLGIPAIGKMPGEVVATVAGLVIAAVGLMFTRK